MLNTTQSKICTGIREEAGKKQNGCKETRKQAVVSKVFRLGREREILKMPVYELLLFPGEKQKNGKGGRH